MLRSVRDLQNFRVISAEGLRCGLVKNLYFDDRSWAITHIVAALEPRRYGGKQVLVSPSQVAFDDEGEALRLTIPAAEVGGLPPAAMSLPVCKQYESMSLASPGASALRHGLSTANPCLRSAQAVFQYSIIAGGKAFAGSLADFIFEEESFIIRYLALEQFFERRKVRFHVLPQAVERFTWTTRRTILRDIQATELSSRDFARSLAA